MPNLRAALFERSRQALGTTQADLGTMLGVARRTAQRWAQHGVPESEMPALARAVYPHNANLAGEIAAALGTTLEALAIVPPPRPALPPPAPPPPAEPPPPPLPDAVVDAVVCAAAEAMDMTPRDVRAGLHAAFSCAKEIGLTVDAVERVLRKKRPPAPAVSAKPAPDVVPDKRKARAS